jgi:hypothetical protein
MTKSCTITQPEDFQKRLRLSDQQTMLLPHDIYVEQSKEPKAPVKKQKADEKPRQLKPQPVLAP